MIRVLDVEMRRLLARRSFRVMTVFVLLGITLAATLVFFNTQKEDTSPAKAAAVRAAFLRDCKAGNGPFYFEAGPESISPERLQQICEENADQYTLENIQSQTFHYKELREVLFGIGPMLLIASLIVGASFIGAEWHHRTVTTTLTWEPRRLRLIGAKFGAAMIIVGLAVIALQVYLALALLPAALLRGTMEGTDAVWLRTLAGQMARIAGMGAGAAAIGMAVGTIARNTAAAIGGAFIYLAVAERLIVGFRPGWGSWSLGDNAAVWLTGAEQGNIPDRTVVVAAMILLAYCAAFIATATASFRRQDIG